MTKNSTNLLKRAIYVLFIFSFSLFQSTVLLSQGSTSDSCSAEIIVNIDSSGSWATLIAEHSGSSNSSIVWGNNSSSSQINVDQSGEYCVTVTTETGCTVKRCTYIQLTSPPCTTKIIQEPLSEGNYMLIVEGNGITNNTYNWSNGSTDETITPDISGEYCVTVTDASGCASSSCINIEITNHSNECEVVLFSYPDTLTGGAFIGVDPTGIGPFTYNWSNGSLESFIDVQESNEYCVTVVDANGCIASGCKIIEVTPEPCTLDVELYALDPIIAGEVELRVETDLNHLTVTWSDGIASDSRIVTETGEYCVTLADDNGCAVTKCIYVEVPPVLPDTCHSWIVKEALSDGTYLLIVESEGVGPYQYIWNNGLSTSSDGQLHVAETGEYCVTVYDNSGCSTLACVFIEVNSTEPDSCQSWIVKDLLDDGTYKLRVETQGIAPFTYSWSHSDASGTTVAEDYFYATETGEYCVTLYDARQCASTVCVGVEITPTEPDSCQSWVVKDLLDDGTYKLRVETQGIAPFAYYWSHNDASGTTVTDDYFYATESGEY
ncbi:MAG: hypothetical protein KJP00_04760, partial [Bacteroidia bacterium]|nr:hypothetical protein [Bacteroidia bacterium]